MSVEHILAQSILTRTSVALGGSTCISSTVTGFPIPQQIAATILKPKIHTYNYTK